MEINDKLFKNIAEVRSTDYDDIIRALGIVADFIREKKYILYGGMAIDIALKFRGHKGIYGEGILPDYDFMCADAYNISNELADILALKGFRNVTAINALHLTSRRVRINTVPIADITYIPQGIIDRIPTVKNGEGFLVVHPDFQRIDMLRSFNTMLAYPPIETILHRTEKDIKRFRLLNQVYPVTAMENVPAPKPIPRIGLTQISKALGVSTARSDLVLGGEHAYLYYYAIMAELLGENSTLLRGVDAQLLADLRREFGKLPVLVGVPTGDTMPVLYYTYYTLDIAAVASAKGFSHKEYYNRYMDDLGFRFIRDTELRVEMHDCWGTGVPYHDVLDFCGKYCPNLINSGKGKQSDNFPLLAQPALLLQHFMLRSFAAGKKQESDYYRNMYVYTERLVTLGERLYETLNTKPVGFPYLFSLNIFGGDTYASNEFRFTNSGYAMKLRGQQPTLTRPPFTYEPKFVTDDNPDSDSDNQGAETNGDRPTDQAVKNKLLPAPEYTTDPDNPIYAIDGGITAPAMFARNKTNSNDVF